jgi:hypothetical protein
MMVCLVTSKVAACSSTGWCAGGCGQQLENDLLSKECLCTVGFVLCLRHIAPLPCSFWCLGGQTTDVAFVFRPPWPRWRVHRCISLGTRFES